MTIIPESILKNVPSAESLHEITPSRLDYKMYRLGATLDLSNQFRENNIKVSISTVFDIPALMYLIYFKLKKENFDFKSTQHFVISPIKFANTLFKGQEIENKRVDKINKERNICNILNAINELADKTKKYHIYFKLKRNSKCILTVFPSFKDYVKKQFHNDISIKIFPTTTDYLTRLRRHKRAFFTFIEKLHLKVREQLKGKGKIGNEESLSKKRISRFFFTSKHHFTYKEILDSANKSFAKLGINDSVFDTLANDIVTYKNKNGLTSKETFDNGSELFKEINAMKKQSKPKEEMIKNIKESRASEIVKNKLLKQINA